MAHEEGDRDNLRAILGNDVAIEAHREGMPPFTDGTIIARLAWKYVPSADPNRSCLGPPRTGSVYGQGLKNIRRGRRLEFHSIR